MRTRSGIILFVIGLAVLAAGWVFGPGSVATERTVIARGTPMFPDLAAKLADAAKIDITGHGQHLTLVRTGTGAAAVWGLVQHDGYKVLPARVHALLTSLAELRLLEPRTSNPTLYARLGLEDPAKAASDATEVRVTDAAGAVIVAIDIGHKQARHGGGEGAREDADTLYVRRTDQARSWLARGRVDVDADPQNWLDRDIVNIDAAKIAQVTTTRGDTTIALARPAGKPDAPLAVTKPDPHPPVDDTKLDETGRALELLSFEDVRKAVATAPAVAKTTFRTTAGMAITVSLLGEDKDAWTHFAASGPGSEGLAQLTGGWDYRLGDYKNRLIAPTFATLKPPPTPETISGDKLQGLIHQGAPTPPAADAPAQPPAAPPAGH